MMRHVTTMLRALGVGGLLVGGVAASPTFGAIVADGSSQPDPFSVPTGQVFVDVQADGNSRLNVNGGDAFFVDMFGTASLQMPVGRIFELNLNNQSSADIGEGLLDTVNVNDQATFRVAGATTIQTQLNISSPGSTTIALDPSGSINRIDAIENSVINVLSGSISRLEAAQNQVNVLSGSLTRLDTDRSLVNLRGGTIDRLNANHTEINILADLDSAGRASIAGFRNTVNVGATISGADANFSTSLDVSRSDVHISGGRLENLRAGGSQVFMTGDTLVSGGGEFGSNDDIEIRGGHITATSGLVRSGSKLFLSSDATGEITGDAEFRSGLFTDGSSELDITGGAVGNRIVIRDRSNVNIFGGDVTAKVVLRDDGQLNVFGENLELIVNPFDGHTLLGRLNDGTDIDIIVIGLHDNIHLHNTVVPEPGSLALLGIGGACLLRRRRRAN